VDVVVDPRWKRAAKCIGVPVEEYMARRAAGERRCCDCKDWHHESAFGKDKTGAEGYAHRCKAADSLRQQARVDQRRDQRRTKAATRSRLASPDHTDLLHEIYILAAERRHADIMDKIRAAVGRP
jgi:hypothetical protein